MAMASDKLSDRLKSMMLLDATVPTIDNGGGNSASSLPRRPLVEVVRSRSDEEKKIDDGHLNSKQSVQVDSDEEDDDDDAPPPIHFHGASISAASTTSSNSTAAAATSQASNANANEKDNDNDAPQKSLAEQLLADAALANQEQRKQQTQKEQRRAKKSTFGLKKGFLNSSSSGMKKVSKKKSSGDGGQSSKSQVDGISKCASMQGDATDTAKQRGKESNLIYELDSDGNMIPSTQSSIGNESNQQQQQRNNNNSKDPLQIPEVQSAMLNHLQSSSSQWATSDLLDSIPTNHPKLARGMNDPRYMRELQNMQTKPKETIERLKIDSPEIVEWLMEFCGVMGEHFVKLGEEQEKGKDGKGVESAAAAAVATAADGTKVREMGPLEKKALKKHQQKKNNGIKSKKQPTDTDQQQKNHQQHANSSNSEMDNQVESILGNDELCSILLDPKMQQIMEECSSQGNKLRYYMGQEEYGPKLRKLMEAGLIRMA